MTTAKKWHVADWSPLGWLETGIKLAGLVAAIIALLQALSGGTSASPEGARLVQVIVQIILSLLLVGAIFDRIMEREIIAMIFVVINNIGHWGMVYALLTQPGPGILLVIFAGLFLVGDLVKIRWIVANQISMRGYPPRVLVGLTSIFVIGYAILLVLALTGA